MSKNHMYWIVITLLHATPKQILTRLLFHLHGRTLTFSPPGTSHGRILLSYITRPFTSLEQSQLDGHTNYWEAKDMVAAFLERGYTVDVIDFYDKKFIPRKKYDYYIDPGSNIERIASLINEDCVKIFFATGSYWKFQNEAEQARLLDLQKRRSVALLPRRSLHPFSIESADIILSLCGKFPESTYSFLHKPIHHIPLSTTHMYSSPETKNFDSVRKNFIWFGGAGAVHKGLDLVLEAFAVMPQFSLTVCGKFNEQDFLDAYKKELHETKNIKAVGYINPGSEQFKEIVNNSLGIVFPSCSEGCASSVVISMHAGLIPIVNKETGVAVDTFGIMLPSSTVSDIRNAVHALSAESAAALRTRSESAHAYARAHHTRHRFGEEFRIFVNGLEKNRHA